MALATRTCPERYTVFVVEVDIEIGADTAAAAAAAAGVVVVDAVAAARISAVVPCSASMGKATARQERLAQVPDTAAAAVAAGEGGHRRVGHIRSPGEEARHIVGRIRMGRGRKIVAGRNTCFADIVVVVALEVVAQRMLVDHRE
jgi:hypothetical protein